LVWDGEPKCEGSTAVDPTEVGPVRVAMLAGGERHHRRLIEWVPLLPELGDERVEYVYDGQSRRVRKRVSVWTAIGWVVTRDLAWIYDGWNPVAIYNLQPSYFAHLGAGSEREFAGGRRGRWAVGDQ